MEEPSEPMQTNQSAAPGLRVVRLGPALGGALLLSPASQKPL
jgi:hypothetical protein